MSSVSFTKLVLASAFASILLLSSPTPSSAYTEDTTAWYIVKWKLMFDCRMETGFAYNLYPVGHEKFDKGWRSFHPVFKKRKTLKDVTSRVNPTGAEQDLLTQERAQCQEWLAASEEGMTKKICRQLDRLGIDMRLNIESYARPLEKVSINDNTHPTWQLEIPPAYSYYNQNFGWSETRTFDSARDCPTE